MSPLFLHRRLLSSSSSSSSSSSTKSYYKKWSIKQVTKSNFNESLEEIRSHIYSSDFIAVFLHNTGSSAASWHRVSPFDTPYTAYLKAKYAADRFQILQFAACPFSVRESKLTAYPYNFHLFPRDELKLGMPSYSFSCQASYLTAMAREDFDFNTCIYDGISYLSRVQESAAKSRLGNPIPVSTVMKSSPSPSVADSLFMQRVKLRVQHWKKACTASTTKTDEALIKSLRKLVLGIEEYGSRPCLTIDVCSENQGQLALEMLAEFSDDLVPLLIPSKGGGTQAVRVVLTSSKEDRNLFERELQNLEVEQNKRVRGFREVIDLISASQKPVVSLNSLNDFTFIYSKFFAPLPLSMDEFIRSLRSIFPHIIDVNQMIKEINPLGKVRNISAAMSYLKNCFPAAIDIEIPSEAPLNEGKIHGHNVVRICQFFTKLCFLLKINPNAVQSSAECLEEYANVFNLCLMSGEEALDDGDVKIWTNNNRKVSCENLVFLWGFRSGITAGMLKSFLQGSHEVFSKEFDVRLVDKSCAIVVFWQPILSETFLHLLNSEGLSGFLREMVAEGLRAAGYETYKRACELSLFGADLADSLEKALEASQDCVFEDNPELKPSELCWCSELVIKLEDL